MPALRQAIVRLRALEQRIGNPHAFYAGHAARWHELTVRLTRETVNLMRPPGESAEVWAHRSDTLASKVQYRLHVSGGELNLAGTAAGVTFTLADPDSASGDPAQHADQGVSIADLTRFVQAGQAGQPLGKRLDDRDDGQTPAQIAWRMMYAIKRRAHGFDGLKRAVQRFLGGEASEGQASHLANAILKAWVSVLVPKAWEDWRAWVDAQVRAL